MQVVRRSRLVWIVCALATATGAAMGSRLSAREFRGAWVTAWTSGFFNKEEADATIASARDARITDLFIQVRKNADAYYSSDIEPRGNGIAEGFDPLDYVIKAAKPYSIRVHAWVNVYRVWAATEAPVNPLHIAAQHPEWLNEDSSGKTRATEGLYLDPGVAEARRHVRLVIRDILRKYPVNGIHLDYIRYPGKEWGYSKEALNAFLTPAHYPLKGKGLRGTLPVEMVPASDDPRWMQWRRDQVTTLVKGIRSDMKQIRPKARLTVASICWGNCPLDYSENSAYQQVFQDWRLWLVRGYVSAICPMNYRNQTSGAGQFSAWLAGLNTWSQRKPVYVGIDVSRNTPDETLAQLRSIRQKGLAGFMLFSFNQSDARAALVAALKAAR